MKPRALGIVMLDTQFARPPGDAGNAASWPFPTVIERVPTAYAKTVVDGTFNNLELFQRKFDLLRAQCVSGAISTCGFLSRFACLNSHLNGIAICASTLFKYSKLSAQLHAEKRVAILTIDATFIDETIRKNCAIPHDTIIASPPRNSHFCRAILDESESLDLELASAEWVALACETKAKHPEIGLWLFECANLPPYRQAVIEATGVPVYDALHLGLETYFEGLSRAQVLPLK
jgi:hypothetical protein